MNYDHDQYEAVLAAIRRIARAIDLHSRTLTQRYGVTGPQLIVLRTLQASGDLTVGTLAARVNLSQATVTEILDRLEKRQLVGRARSQSDKRCVLVHVTEVGRRLIEAAPPFLQDAFVQRFSVLQEWEKTLILSSLQRVASMMDAGAHEVETSPPLAGDTIGTRDDEPRTGSRADPGRPARPSTARCRD